MMSEEREYTVTWEIQVSAISHEDAARFCWDEFFSEHDASVFGVQAEDEADQQFIDVKELI